MTPSICTNHQIAAAVSRTVCWLSTKRCRSFRSQSPVASATARWQLADPSSDNQRGWKVTQSRCASGRPACSFYRRCVRGCALRAARELLLTAGFSVPQETEQTTQVRHAVPSRWSVTAISRSSCSPSNRDSTSLAHAVTMSWDIAGAAPIASCGVTRLSAAPCLLVQKCRQKTIIEGEVEQRDVHIQSKNGI